MQVGFIAKAFNLYLARFDHPVTYQLAFFG
jgi:hypothetical protein